MLLSLSLSLSLLIVGLPKQVVKMLIVVVAVFATLWLPYRALLVYNSLAEDRYMELWYLMFCKTMIYMNCAINPILYSVLSIKFRRAFKKMLSCISSQEKRFKELTSYHHSHNSLRQKENLISFASSTKITWDRKLEQPL